VFLMYALVINLQALVSITALGLRRTDCVRVLGGNTCGNLRTRTEGFRTRISVPIIVSREDMLCRCIPLYFLATHAFRKQYYGSPLLTIGVSLIE
jgi:hypothetical protein